MPDVLKYRVSGLTLVYIMPMLFVVKCGPLQNRETSLENSGHESLDEVEQTGLRAPFSQSGMAEIKDMFRQLQNRLNKMEKTNTAGFQKVRHQIKSMNRSSLLKSKQLGNRFNAVEHTLSSGMKMQSQFWRIHAIARNDQVAVTNMLESAMAKLNDFKPQMEQERNYTYTLSKIEDSFKAVEERLEARARTYLSMMEALEEKAETTGKETGQRLGQLQHLLVKLVRESVPCIQPPQDCLSLFYCGRLTSSVYGIQPGGLAEVSVWCDMVTLGGGWTVIQSRRNADTDFNRNYTEYERGFGEAGANFWVGLRALHALTSPQQAQLYVHLQTVEGKTAHALYTSFKVSGPEDGYRLTLSGYSGTAGDSFGKHHTGSRFTTRDRDQDTRDGYNCGEGWAAGWWYHAGCYHANLNGAYRTGPVDAKEVGIKWRDFTGYEYSLSHVYMMIRTRYP